MRPNGKTININSLKINRHHDHVIGKVEVLGDNEVASVSRTTDCLAIELKNEPKDDLPLCFKIELE